MVIDAMDLLYARNLDALFEVQRQNQIVLIRDKRKE